VRLTPKPTPPPVAVIEAAVRAYIGGVNIALRGGGLSAAEKASTPTCTCRKELNNIAAVYARHEHFVGTHVVVTRIVPTTSEGMTAQAKLTFSVPASSIANAAGKRVKLRAQPTTTVTATLTLVGHNWLVSALEGVTSSTVPKARRAAAKPSRGATPTPAPSG
jgi:hypothetical protein